MKIIKMLESKKPLISFEIFPPKPDMPLETLYDSLAGFKSLNPDFISVTYGAGGSQKGRTIEIAAKIKKDYGIESMAHFTCVGHTEAEIDALLDSMHLSGLENILALRGDPPLDQPGFDFNKSTYVHACELVGHIRRKNNFCVAAAAYVEGHVESKRIKQDMLHLKEKVEAGVDFLVTQLFFDNRLFYEFLDRAASIGINCPVIPGIMPIFSGRIKNMTARSGCSIPATLVLMMDKYQQSPDELRKAGIEYAAGQIRDLLDSGADGVHIYTMNRLGSTREIMEAAGLFKGQTG